MNDLPFKVTTLLTGGLVSGEALALAIGMHALGEGDDAWISFKNDLFLVLDIVAGLSLGYLALGEGEDAWISFKNDLFLVLDIVAGLSLGYLALAHRGPAWSYVLYVLVGLALLTHGCREWEYLAGAGNPFCVNTPLFLVNNVKLVGLVAILVLSRGLGQVQGS